MVTIQTFIPGLTSGSMLNNGHRNGWYCLMVFLAGVVISSLLAPAMKVGRTKARAVGPPRAS